MTAFAMNGDMASMDGNQFVALSEIQIRGGHLVTGDDDEELAFELRLEESGPLSRHVKLIVYPFHDIEFIKRLLLKKLCLTGQYKISEIEIFYNGLEIPNRRLLTSFANQLSPVKLKWKIKDKIAKGATLKAARPRGDVKIHPSHEKLLQDLQIAFSRRMNPKLSEEGTGGTYLVYNVRGRPIGVFKPHDEEAFAPNNPRGYVGKFGQAGFRAGVVSGEGATREVAAFLLDAYYGSFSGVPITSIVEMVHPHFCYDSSAPKATRGTEDLFGGVFKIKKKQSADQALTWKVGSLQDFVQAKDTCADYDPRLFSIADVHKIAILDIRLANMDRNDGNILVLKSEEAELFNINPTSLHPSFLNKYPEHQNDYLTTMDNKQTKLRLIPIDHGLTLPDCLDITDFDLAWLNWPQADHPLLPAEREYVQKLKPDSDAEWLAKKLQIRPACLRVMRTTTRLLQAGTAQGLTLRQIGRLMVRLSPDKPSPLERVIKLAVEQACVATYATSLVHKRDSAMRYAMDLAGVNDVPSKNVEETPKPTTSQDRARNTVVKWRGVNNEEEGTPANENEANGPGPRPRSKTVGRVSLNPLHSSIEQHTSKATARLRNFTAWRSRDELKDTSVNNLWVTHDSGGRVVQPDWEEPKYNRLFFESFENLLQLLIAEKVKRLKGEQECDE